MALTPQVIHGAGVPPVLASSLPATIQAPDTMTGPVVPYQNYHLPTGVLILAVLVLLIVLHVVGFRGGAIVGLRA
jgi:hypothetical protein